jgi:hypothetical protein
LGIAVLVGGGAAGFTDHMLRSATDVGGAWNVRATFGTHMPLAFDAAYVGSATGLDSLLGPAHTTLIGTAFEGDVRMNFAPDFVVSPYVLAGLGWQRYSTRDVAFVDTGIRSSDDLLIFPFGVGVVYRFGGLIADLRGTVRVVHDSDLVIDRDGHTLPMHSWEASAALGCEF